MKIRKIFIANRGEIVCRIARTASRLGICTCGVFTPQDAHTLPVRTLEEMFELPAGELSQNYLNQELLIQTARSFSAQAVHPGYGFLSENPEFAERVQKAGLIWIGPPPQSMRELGGKIQAKAVAARVKVPAVPWKRIVEQPSQQEVGKIVEELGLPILIKAAHGGGGRGQRVVTTAPEFDEALKLARSESLRSFGSAEVFAERFLERPRHIEVQIIADQHGNYYALGERDCSLQRRNQKVVEETPAVVLDDATRSQIHGAAITLAKSVGYTNAGTIEFLAQKKKAKGWEFFFMELNARLQVEHTITEQTWNLDLVELQIRIAEGENLKKKFASLKRPSGHAIELRLCAEDPENRFLPAPGPIVDFVIPGTKDLRVDAGYESGDIVPQEYDSLVAKLILHSKSRSQTISDLIKVLDRSLISGVVTNKFFLREVLNHPDFQGDRVYSRWIESHPELTSGSPDLLDKDLGYWGRKWSSELFVQRKTAKFDIRLDSYELPTLKILTAFQPGELHGSLSAQGLVRISGNFELANGIRVTAGGWINRFELFITFTKKVENVGQRKIHFVPKYETIDLKTQHGPIVAQVPGVVLDVRVKPKDIVEARSPILVIEAMKIEMPMSLAVNAKITGIHVKPGDRIQPGQTLITWELVE